MYVDPSLIDIAFFLLIFYGSTLISKKFTAYEEIFSSLGFRYLSDINDASSVKVIQSEFMRNRYSENPISLINVKVSNTHEDPIKEELVKEIYSRYRERNQLTQLAREIKREMRLIDHIFFDEIDEQLIILCPDLGKEDAEAFSKFLVTKLERFSKLNVKSSFASFPEDDVTFNGLLEKLKTKQINLINYDLSQERNLKRHETIA